MLEYNAKDAALAECLSAPAPPPYASRLLKLQTGWGSCTPFFIVIRCPAGALRDSCDSVSCSCAPSFTVDRRPAGLLRFRVMFLWPTFTVDQFPAGYLQCRVVFLRPIFYSGSVSCVSYSCDSGSCSCPSCSSSLFFFCSTSSSSFSFFRFRATCKIKDF